MVRAVIIARFGVRIGRRYPVIAHQRLVQEQIELRFARPNDGHILRRTGHQERIHVDTADRLVEREDRVCSVIIGTEQAGFLGSDRQKHETAFGRPRFCVRFGQGYESSSAGGIIDCSVADVVAIGCRRAAAQVIPVCRVHHIFVGTLATGKNADHVLGCECTNVVAEARRCLEPERHRLEIVLARSSHQIVEILTRSGENFTGLLLLHPAVQLCHRRRIVAAVGVCLRARPAAFDDVPAIGGRFGVVDDDSGRRALPSGFFVFVRPATVIGHRLPVEGAVQGFGAEVRIIDENDRGLTLHVQAFVIVPALFRRVYAVAHEYQLAVIEFGFHVFAICRTDPVGGVIELDIAIVAA